MARASVCSPPGKSAYAGLVKAEKDAEAAYKKIVADALANDQAYTTAKQQSDAIGKKDDAPKAKLKNATPEERPAIEAELAALKAQDEPLRKTMDERKKAAEALPEVVAAKKAKDDADAAKGGFATQNPEYGKLLAAEKEAQVTYSKAREAAKDADTERSTLQQQVSELQKRIDASK